MNLAASSILRVMGIGGRASSAAWQYRPSGTARQSRILMTQVSVSVRMARPNPCRSFFCISGTTTAWMYSCKLGYCSFSASLNGSGTGNGSRAKISDDTISPGKSTPSQQEPAAKSTAFPISLNCRMTSWAFRQTASNGNGNPSFT